MFAGHYDSAADLYAKGLAAAPEDSDLYYGLVRALVNAHRSQEAYATAERAAQKTTQTPALLSAAGLADYRKGDLIKAEDGFRAALKLNPQYPGALAGLASIFATVSRFKTAQNLLLSAYERAPSDPDLMLAYAGFIKGAQHLAQLERILAVLDPHSERAQDLRAQIAYDRATGDRKLHRLTSPYEKGRVKMAWLLDGPKEFRGFSVQVQLNGKQTAHLLLDTGAGGISITPKMAERAGLEKLADLTSEAKGIGDQQAPTTFAYIATELRIGGVTFADYPVSAFRSAKSPDYDGLIGADVFRQFIVTLDFPNLEITLEPRPGGPRSMDDPVDAGPTPAPGFHRVLRIGDHLVLNTSMNDKPSGLFLLDSGSTANLIDTAVAKKASRTYGDDMTHVSGIQGKVNKVSRADSVSLLFAGFRQDNADLIAIDMTSVGDGEGVGLSGILGMPVLAQLRVTIDYLEGTLKLERPKK